MQDGDPHEAALKLDPLSIKTKQNVKILTSELKLISNQTSTYKLAFTGGEKKKRAILM